MRLLDRVLVGAITICMVTGMVICTVPQTGRTAYAAGEAISGTVGSSGDELFAGYVDRLFSTDISPMTVQARNTQGYTQLTSEQNLCDASGIDYTIVTGDMGGYPDLLFMKGASSGTAAGYTVSEVTYSYDEKTLGLFTDKKRILAKSDYNLNVAGQDDETDWTEDFTELGVSEYGDTGYSVIIVEKRTVLATDNSLHLKATAMSVENGKKVSFSDAIKYHWEDANGENGGLTISQDTEDADTAVVKFGENLTLSQKTYKLKVTAKGTSEAGTSYGKVAYIDIIQEAAVIDHIELTKPQPFRTSFSNKNTTISFQSRLLNAAGKALTAGDDKYDWYSDDTAHFEFKRQSGGKATLSLTSSGKESTDELYTTAWLVVDDVRSDRKEIVYVPGGSSSDTIDDSTSLIDDDQNTISNGVITAVGANMLLNVTGSSTATFTGVIDKNATMLTIPESVAVNGITYYITDIAKKALANNTNIRMLTIEASVQYIGKKAFKGMKSVKTIELYPNAYMEIEKKAFKGLKSGTEVVIYTDDRQQYEMIVDKIKAAGGNNLDFTRR